MLKNRYKMLSFLHTILIGWTIPPKPVQFCLPWLPHDLDVIIECSWNKLKTRWWNKRLSFNLVLVITRAIVFHKKTCPWWDHAPLMTRSCPLQSCALHIFLLWVMHDLQEVRQCLPWPQVVPILAFVLVIHILLLGYKQKRSNQQTCSGSISMTTSCPSNSNRVFI